ncbi:hypothetical protein NC652_021158 [Populus alba x Populus x berolinensis]|nr:hypothetical protein NC652_021158 [Populus alba x Populus x berolinensis]
MINEKLQLLHISNPLSLASFFFCKTSFFSCFDSCYLLLRIKNQIPLFILQRLFEVVQIPKQCTHFLTELAFRLIKYMIPRDPRIHQQKFNQEGKQPNTPLINQSNQKHLRCAAELQAAGIRIKGARTENLLDIKFVSGVLVIPPVIIH